MKLNRKFAVGALTLGVLLFLAGWRAVDLRRSRADLLEVADARARNLAHILAEYITGAFAGGDAALRQLAVHGARMGGLQAPAGEWLPSLAQARAGLAGIGSISVTDDSGAIRHSTRPEIVGQLRDEWTIREALNDPDGGNLIVGPPVRAVVPPYSYIIPLARRLRRADGTLDGVIVASFIPFALRDFFRTVDVGAHGTVWVFHPSGVVLVREPSAADPLGEDATKNAVFDAAQRQPESIFQGRLVPGGPVQRAAFSRVGTLPLTVVVSLDEEEVLAPWRREVMLSAVAIIGVVFVFGVVLSGLFRQMDVADTAERSLVEARTAEAARLRAAHEQLESAFARAQADRATAERASALKDEFLMTVSHELRTPLGVIVTGATLLDSGRLSERERGQTLDAIKRNARLQARLIDDLLDVSHGMAGTLRLDVGPVAVADIIRAAVETVAVAAGAKGVRLDVSIDPAAGSIRGDGARLQQVIWNLLSNAVKFTSAGGEVRVGATREGSVVLVSVEDTGIGISQGFLPHVFDRFRQEHTGVARPFGGLGIGLAIARHLVELHGGEISVHSDGPQRGTRFTVRLPGSAPHDLPLAQARASEAG